MHADVWHLDNHSTMTRLMNISIIWASFLMFGFSPTPSFPPQEANLYCSEDYHFCAKFPASILTEKITLPQENGIFLKTEDGFAEVIIAGFPLLEDMSPKSVFLASAREKTSPSKEPKVISSIFGEDFYECYFMVDRYFYYHQAYFFNDYFVRVEIKAPINMPDKLQILQQQIRLDFNEPPLEGNTSESEEIGGLRD